MARRDMAVHGAVVLALIVGIVGGNFCVHRWLLSDVTSRTADAGTSAAQPDDLDLAQLAPRPANRNVSSNLDRATARERLRAIIAERLPNATDDERAAWFESLRDVPLVDVNGILELRQQLGPLPSRE